MSVVILGATDASTRAVAQALAADAPVLALLIEEPPNRWAMLRRRMARHGVLRVTGQLLFIVLARLMALRSRRRIAEIWAGHRLRDEVPPHIPVYPVPSVNAPETLALLERLAPRVVVVNGTRIISERLLRALPVPFINMHAGITPKYRGVHGGYWALVRGDAANAGVSVHLVDAGIDTGEVLYQARIRPGARDNFCTYPALQLAAGIPLLKQAVRDALAGTLQPSRPALPSELFSHPTLWEYVWMWLAKGVH